MAIGGGFNDVRDEGPIRFYAFLLCAYFIVWKVDVLSFSYCVTMRGVYTKRALCGKYVEWY